VPDISMCQGDECPLKEKCYRYLAKPNEYQSYFVTPPYKDDGSCDHLWDLSKSKENPLSHISRLNRDLE